MCCLEVQNYQHNTLVKHQKEFFISDTERGQTVITATFSLPMFSFPNIIPRGLLSFLGSDSGKSQPDPRFKMILWSIIAGTRGGINRAKILNLVKETPMNAHQISTTLGLDHKTVAHHVKILAKNELVIKAEKNYGADYDLSQIMKDNQSALEEIMQKIGTK